eukprot:TRINITY_DN16237_c0_g1_i1.p1 TRINITY_DN16237_c0_g1~~TRINITY_DN16237_c0_g1_i1.p1  ORF type:complete len:462 (-),score=71.34 TRINITY_DN16237_c0_g1_i1:48-1388(-)
MEDISTKTLFEAAFTADSTRIRVDVLSKTDDSWDLIEVKSSTSAKPVHDHDLMIQYHVLTSLGIKIRNLELMVINNQYIYDEAIGLDVNELFKFIDRTSELKNSHNLNVVKGYLEVFHRYLNANELDQNERKVRKILPSPHCNKPYECPFKGFCYSQHKQMDWIANIPGLNDKLYKELSGRSFDLSKISDTEMLRAKYLNPLQRRALISMKKRAEYVDYEGLIRDLGERNSDEKRFYLDFEAFSSAVPTLQEQRPYQMIPFQWSCHIEHGDQLDHAEFLYSLQKEQHPSVKEMVTGFTDSLLELFKNYGMSDNDRIFIYSSYEITTITKAKNVLGPSYPRELDWIISRCEDLLKAARSNYYHHELRGSFGLKAMYRVLKNQKGNNYHELDVQEGTAASHVFAEAIVNGMTPKAKRNLLEYCKLDTQAMVDIRSELLKRALPKRPPV